RDPGRWARRACRSRRTSSSIQCSITGPKRAWPRSARRTASGFSATERSRGGFIAERWLGAPEPQPPFANRSLVKYRLIIEDFGGWDRFQELLFVLDAIAKRRRVSMASVAIRYVLDKPGGAVAIVAARNGAHLDDAV